MHFRFKVNLCYWGTLLIATPYANSHIYACMLFDTTNTTNGYVRTCLDQFTKSKAVCIAKLLVSGNRLNLTKGQDQISIKLDPKINWFTQTYPPRIDQPSNLLVVFEKVPFSASFKIVFFSKINYPLKITSCMTTNQQPKTKEIACLRLR